MLVVLKMLFALSAKVREGYSTQLVCQSVNQSVIPSQDLEDVSLPNLKQASKCCTGNFRSYFSFDLLFLEKS